MTGGWPSILDEMERRLVAAEQSIAEGRFSFEPVALPPSLGPLPASCRDRAEAIYVATVEMEGRLTVAMAEIAGHLARRPPTEEPRPTPAYVDRVV